MDALRQRLEVEIEGANDEARVWLAGIVQTDEMTSVEGNQESMLFSGKRQYCFVWHRLVGVAHFLDGQDIMTQSAKGNNRRQGEVLLV